MTDERMGDLAAIEKKRRSTAIFGDCVSVVDHASMDAIGREYWSAVDRDVVGCDRCIARREGLGRPRRSRRR